MRALMNLIKDRHGTYHAQRKVPERIQAAVASVLGQGKARQVFLKRSLGTKDVKLANKRATLVLHEFDQIFSKAEAQVVEAPPQARRTSLNSAEIRLVADYIYAKLMREDEEWRFGGKRYLEKQEAWLRREGVEFKPFFNTATLPDDGISAEQLKVHYEHLRYELEIMQGALAQGDVSAVADDLDIALDALGIPLEVNSDGYRAAGIESLRAYVRALRDIEKRDAGEPIETPAFNVSPALGGATLEAAYDGWTKQRVRPQSTLNEYKRGIDLFTQLHGVLPVASIKRSHAREFREALQLVPRTRTGKLLKASLPELRDYGRSHPAMQKISSGTVNKLLGAVQAICVWARDNGFIPDDLHWADPFNKMRVAEAESERTSFEIEELQCLFDSPVFTKRDWPQGARGVTAVWLPLLALFTGARRSELAGLTVADIQLDKPTRATFIAIRAEAKRGKALKTKTSQRVIPVHSQLMKLGFLKYVEQIRESAGKDAWLFPLVAPDKGYALAAWTKWFGRYLRAQGVHDTAKVFHSFRHSFKDALRKGGVNPEVHDALTGHANASTVSGGYGSKDMLQRFGAKVLASAIAKVKYPELNLSRIDTGVSKKSRA